MTKLLKQLINKKNAFVFTGKWVSNQRLSHFHRLPCLLAGHHFAMLWASVANTIPACFWSMYNLVSHPDALQVVRQQILDILNLSGVEFSTDKDVTLSKEFLDKLLYLGQAL